EAQRQAEDARAQRDRAEEGLRHARESLDLMIEFCEKELADQPALQALRVRLLEMALADYQGSIEHLRGDPAELARTQERVNNILADLAVLRGSGRVFRLDNPAVLEDLGLSEDQRKKVAALRD